MSRSPIRMHVLRAQNGWAWLVSDFVATIAHGTAQTQAEGRELARVAKVEYLTELRKEK